MRQDALARGRHAGAHTVEHVGLGQALHVRPLLGVLPDGQVAGGRVQQVADGLVVDLQEGAAAVVLDGVAALGVLLVRDLGVQVLENTRRQATLQGGMGGKGGSGCTARAVVGRF